ncbi:hypothetical protein AAKU64_004379 [Undibacterium sp. GrIS 1.8]
MAFAAVLRDVKRSANPTLSPMRLIKASDLLQSGEILRES